MGLGYYPFYLHVVVVEWNSSTQINGQICGPKICQEMFQRKTCFKASPDYVSGQIGGLKLLPSFGANSNKVEPPKTNNDCKINTMYHMHTFGSTYVCMWYIVLVLLSLLVLGGSTLVVAWSACFVNLALVKQPQRNGTNSTLTIGYHLLSYVLVLVLA